jgi:hypothetical protein
MADNETINDFKLDQMAKDYAVEILKEIKKYGGDAYDLAHEYTDNSEWAIYPNKAHELCQNCNTELGEQLLEDSGLPETPTYNGLASYIAYGEINSRIKYAIDDLKKEVSQ